MEAPEQLLQLPSGVMVPWLSSPAPGAAAGRRAPVCRALFPVSAACCWALLPWLFPSPSTSIAAEC